MPHSTVKASSGGRTGNDTASGILVWQGFTEFRRSGFRRRSLRVRAWVCGAKALARAPVKKWRITRSTPMAFTVRKSGLKNMPRLGCPVMIS
jgi:hypothetical protein